jgi:predicted TIM-barrel fold metal-dependent hydrolase
VHRAGRAALDAAERARALRGRQRASDVTAIERVAGLRERIPEGTSQRLEYAVSAASGPHAYASGSVRRLVESMDRHGIERTVVIASHGVAGNDWLLGEAVAEAPGRLVPCAIPPDLPEGASAEAWTRAFDALADAGAAGFKIHPNFDVRPPEHPVWRALFEVATARGRFVIVHTGQFTTPLYVDRSPAAPARFEPLFAAFPAVRVCLAHMNRERAEAAWEVMRRHDLVYADTSWQTPDAVRRAVEAVGEDRILLGSDWPLLHRDLQGDALAVLRRAVPGAVADRIARDNAVAFLGG